MSTTFPGAVGARRFIDERFPLLQELGRTEWSAAYLTELDDGRLQKAAIKIFPFETVEADSTLARWDVARTVQHPHLMPLFYAGRCEVDGEDLLYVVTEYADETLSQVLPERPLSTKEARDVLGPILEALSFLHKRCLTHGHLRPTNVMVVDDQLKLSPDFGWCRRTRNIYDAPEAGSQGAGPAGDIWSLGILLVEALTQQPPVWDESHGELEVPASIPEPFYTICRECLRTDPEQRCTLAGIEAHLNPPAPEEPEAETEAVVEPVAKPSLKLSAFVAGGAAVLLLLIFAAFKFGWEMTPSSPATTSQPQATAKEATTAPAPRVATASAPAATPPAETAPSSQPTATTQPSPDGQKASTEKPAQTTQPAPAAVAAPAADQAPKAAPAAQAADGNVVKGSVAHQVLPDIPTRILDTVQGHIRVQIRVEAGADGNVTQATIDTPGPSRYFANQALQAAESWKFTPAQVDGHAAASTWLLQFEFGQPQTVVTQSEVSP
jgi:TonB family protein